MLLSEPSVPSLYWICDITDTYVDCIIMYRILLIATDIKVFGTPTDDFHGLNARRIMEIIIKRRQSTTGCKIVEQKYSGHSILWKVLHLDLSSFPTSVQYLYAYISASVG